MKETINFCQEPSEALLRKLEESNGDPKSAIGQHALDEMGKNKRGWQPAWDARDARNSNL